MLRDADAARAGARDPASEKWQLGARRVGDVVVIRNRWHGFFGVTVWLTLPLAMLVYLGVHVATTRQVCDPTITHTFTFGESTISWPTCESFVDRRRGLTELDMTGVRLAIGSAVALIVVGARWYPVVELGPTDVRWRTRRRWHTVPTTGITGLAVVNRNPYAWAPMITATIPGGTRRQRRRGVAFAATYTCRRRTAASTCSVVQGWADEHAIPCELSPDELVWRLHPPPGRR